MLFFLAFAALCAASPVKQLPFQDNRLVEVMIPMRDGVELHTVIVFPRAKDGQTQFPVIMDRSPYGYQDLEWIADIFVPFGFVSVGQDMRGTEKSQGNFSMWTSDANDSRDLGDWIASQAWSNGQIMTFGASADGIGSLQTIKTAPQWLAGQYIAWATSNAYDILFPTGAYKQKTTEDWLLGVDMPNPDVVYDNIELVHENEAHTEFWGEVELSPTDFSKVNFISGFWAGWYDLFLMGTLHAFHGYNTQSDESVRGLSVLTIDPLGHCLDFADFFTEDVVAGRTALVLAQMFATYGIFPVARSNIHNITFYVMSSNDAAGRSAGQFWTSVEAWPRYVPTSIYFHGDGTATSTIPSDATPSSSSYVYDPANPVPTLGGNNLPDSIGGTIPCGPMDQREADQRSDVLTFQTPVYATPLYLTGPLMATLFVSSDAIDTDFTVKISDVYPTGEVLLIQDNAVRMRWRKGGLSPVYMTKGEVYEVEMSLWNTSYVVAPGHALRVSVSSSNSPRFAPNPNNGLLLSDPKYPGTNITATNTLYHSSRYPSKVTLPVVQKHQLPVVHMLKEVQKMYPSLDDAMVKTHIHNLNKLSTRHVRKLRSA